ncbi:putative late blight resistance protein homolog R1B-17 [Coffea eugenioides]|uniref:putative late blight resistance protein homolog R1B-17 n=1 Tax=Coffea eugenioides TaxID=49369 RepID=UPI000F6081D9|nr:putative late blight resistance protein homolog R1B-17 [Coffea eugenioides]
MASTCSIDRVLLGLESLRNSSGISLHLLFDVRIAIKRMKFLKTFLMCARKWSQSNDLYLQSDNVVKRVSLPAFLSCIEDTFHKYEEDIHSLSRDKIYVVFREIQKEIISLKQEIIQIYFALATLASNRSFQSNSCMTDDELLEFIDLILQNLAALRNLDMNWQITKYSICAALSAQVQDLEAKLTFLKSFIPFAKMRGTADIPALLLAHFEVVALTAAGLSYMWSFWNDFEAKHNPEFYGRSICSFKLLIIIVVDFHVYEIYKEVLAASNSSASLHTAVMDERILNNFNDSLIGRLWELLCCSSSSVDSMKDEMQTLYAELRFLRSILREHHKMMDEQNEKIGVLLGEAGIILFSPTLSRVIAGEVSFSGSTQVLDFRHMLANIKHFKDQISGSSTIESLPNSSHSLRAPEVSQTSSRMLSKGEMPIDHEVMVGLDDGAEKGIEPLIKDFEEKLSVSSTIKSLPNSSHSLRAPEVSQTSSRMLSKGKMPIAREIMVGLDDEAAKVIERLVSGPEHVEIVPIVGMAGLGKTTLAKKVYNDNSIIYNFHIRLWCTVSQEYNKKSLLTQILCSDGKHSRMDDLNEDNLLQKLRQRLLQNRYLVVFDDVWDIEVWNELRNAFPNDKNQSRIIFTSRSSNVASQVQYGGEPHKIRCLTVEESFELLQKKVFGEEEECPQALHELGMEIAEKCWGLPLALVVVAGVLATIEHDILLWEKFAESLTSTMVSGTDQWKKSLELSYEHLPYHLKACLLYFAAFREDEKIGAKSLMRLWIAEGFVEIIEGKRSEDTAEEYLMDLIGRNLVMVSKSRSIGGVKTCYFHDLIFEFCKGEAKEKKFLQVLRGYDELSTFNEPPNLPRLSIRSSGEDFIKSRLFCPHLASLLFFDATPGYHKFELFNISFLFCIYKRLEVLNLEGINLRLKELPAEVESLLCLRYLALTALLMRCIPSSIAKLSHLETFCLNSKEKVSLRDSIWNMKKLRHVYVRGGVVIRLPSNDNVVENLSTLPNLDTLSCLCLCEEGESSSSLYEEGENLYEEGENLLRRIPNVRRLKIYDRQTGNGVLNLSRLECLESLTWSGNYSSGSWEHVEPPFPMNLKKLSLRNLGLPCSKMSLIEQLPNLEVLKLRDRAMVGQRWELMVGGFPKLRVLTLEDVEVAEWTEADPDSDDYFPRLQQLNLQRIYNLEMMPACLGSISTLETIQVGDCRDGVKSLVREIEAAQEYNNGNENLKIIYGNTRCNFSDIIRECMPR